MKTVNLTDDDVTELRLMRDELAAKEFDRRSESNTRDYERDAVRRRESLERILQQV